MKQVRNFLLVLLVTLPPLLGTAQMSLSQRERLTIQAVRITETPKVDGVLNDPAWREEVSSQRTYFVQNSPDNGEPSAFESEVYVAYTDRAIYIAAQLYDDNPDSILTELGLRDDGNRNADMFGVGFDPYHKRQNAFVFWLTAAGVQGDSYSTTNNMDDNWNAVWKSGVKINEEGWAIEMEIPYSQLRFPKQEIQTWGINFYRSIRRYQEESFWNFVDANVDGLVNQYGDVAGIENIEPPLRLSITPYVSAYMNQQGQSGMQPSINGGMDLKYGINESFTLDMSLIPDFGQVQSDNIVLNLSAFEVRLDENRPFFTEGTELFNRTNLFYSRRVGSTTQRLGEVYDDEEIISRPSQAPLLNATKVSGRTRGGLGLGVFNAVTNRTYLAVGKENHTTSEEGDYKDVRQVLADPITNFNTLVFDQNLKNNSNISLTNTNVWREGRGRDANATRVDFTFNDKNNTWYTRGFGAYSYILDYDSDSGKMVPDLGYAYNLSVGKQSGTFQFSVNHTRETDNYNVNDMGFLFAPNENSYNVWAMVQKSEPFSIFNNANINANVNYTRTHLPDEFDNFNVNWNFNMGFKNFWYLWLGSGVNPVTNVDHFEARTAGYVFRKPGSFRQNFWLSTDSRKAFRIGMGGGVWTRPEWKSVDNWFEFNPRFRFSDKFTLEHSFEFQRRRNEYGFATKRFDDKGNLSEIIIGDREVRNLTNTFAGSYTFNPFAGITLRVRHYWSRVAYDRFWQLSEDGYLSDTDYTVRDAEGVPRHDENFNFFSLDLVYSWQFAPGSFLSVVWKNNINTSGRDTQVSYRENWETMLTSDNMLNSFSLRMIYFLDYQDAKSFFKR
ncbi:MAG: DUF5916 domain-containing protein [Bacteroidota bacterium]